MGVMGRQFWRINWGAECIASPWRLCYNATRSDIQRVEEQPGSGRMTAEQTLKHKLLLEIEKLSEYRLQEVLDFARFLRSRDRFPVEYERQDKKLDSDQDPILQFIGRVSHGTLAQGIDEELYGA